MPYFKRGTLHHQLELRANNNDPMGQAEVLDLFRQICLAVQSIHDQGLAHRDLKPHNVLFDEAGGPVIMDLGSVEPARLTISTHSQAQQLQDLASERCSITYRPPELFQVSSKCDIDERTDIWVSKWHLHIYADI